MLTCISNFCVQNKIKGNEWIVLGNMHRIEIYHASNTKSKNGGGEPK